MAAAYQSHKLLKYWIGVEQIATDVMFGSYDLLSCSLHLCWCVVVSGSSLMTMWFLGVKRTKLLSRTLAEVTTRLVSDSQQMLTCLSTYTSHISVCNWSVIQWLGQVYVLVFSVAIVWNFTNYKQELFRRIETMQCWYE